MSDEIINRVANSSLVTFDIEEFRPQGERTFFDIKSQLYQGMILKEKEFRKFLKEHDWNQYLNQYVAIGSSVDAIIPTWAYMLLAIKLQPFAKKVVFGNLNILEHAILKDHLDQIDYKQFKEKRIVIKGCSDQSISEQAYINVVQRLIPFATSVMFGEPCSTVPLFKKPKK